MNTPEHDLQADALRGIAASLKAIQSSLDKLTGAVEGVSESIETAHQPEGDLGVHLVNALKDLTSSLQKRAQQERVDRQQRPQQQLNRRDERPPRRGDGPFAEHRETPEEPPHHDAPEENHAEHPVAPEVPAQASREHSPSDEPPTRKPSRRAGPNRGRRGGKNRSNPDPKPRA